jgi:UDP-glucose 4-epimerase
LEHLKRERYDVINYHAYSYSKIHGTSAHDDVVNNLTSFIELLERVKEVGIGKVIYISTSGVAYGECEFPADEDSPFVCECPLYNLKRLGELYLREYSEMYGFEYTILRYSNVFGPRQGEGVGGGVVSNFIKAMLMGEVPTIHGDGEQTRDFIYVKDVARANFLALTSGAGEIFNIASQEETTITKLLEMIKERTGYGGDIASDENFCSLDIRRNVMNNEKAKNILGFYPDYGLEDSLNETVDYFKKSTKWKK